MSIKKIITTPFLLALSLLLTACVDRVADRDGAKIEVVPVTYTYRVEVKKGKYLQAKNELEVYVQENWNRISSRNITLTWYSESGEKLAEEMHQYLLHRGVNRSQLAVRKGVEIEDNPFDIQLQSVVNKVVADVCAYEQVGRFSDQGMGCYAESVRWKSMVNPEKMLSANQQ